MFGRYGRHSSWESITSHRRFDLERLGEARKPFFSSRLFGRHVSGACDWSRAHTLSQMPELEMSKFALAPHPLDAEGKKRKMEPTPEFKQKQIEAQRAVLGRAGSNIFKEVLAKTEAKELIEKIGDKVDEDYIHDFRNWIAGIGKRSDYVKGGVPLSSVGHGKPLSRDPTVINFIDKLTGRVIDYYAEIANMKMRGPGVGRRGGPATLNDLWLYFKYVVRNDPIDPRDFTEASTLKPDAALVGNQDGIIDSQALAPSMKKAHPDPGEHAKRQKPADAQSRKKATPKNTAKHIAGDEAETTLPVTDAAPDAPAPDSTPAVEPMKGVTVTPPEPPKETIESINAEFVPKVIDINKRIEHDSGLVDRVRTAETRAKATVGISPPLESNPPEKLRQFYELMVAEAEDIIKKNTKMMFGKSVVSSSTPAANPFAMLPTASSAPAKEQPLTPEEMEEVKRDFPAYYEKHYGSGKVPAEPAKESVVPAVVSPAPVAMDYSDPYAKEEQRKREEDAARAAAVKRDREAAAMALKAREEEEARKEREYAEAKRKHEEAEARRSAPPPEPTKATVTPEPAAVEPLKIETPPAAAAVPKPEAVAIENVVKDTVARVNPADAPPGFAVQMKRYALKAMADWTASHPSSMMAKEEYEQRRLEAGVAATEAVVYAAKAVASGVSDAAEAASDYYHKTMKALEESHARKKEADIGIAEELVFGDGRRPVDRIKDPSLARKIGLATAQYGKPLPSEGFFMNATLYRLAKRAHEDVAGPENSSIDAKEFLSALAKRIPSLPSAPSLPSLPSFPRISLPSISAPEISLPKFSLPSFGGSGGSAPEAPTAPYDDSWKFIKLPEPAAVPPSPIPAAATPTPEPSMFRPPPQPAEPHRYTPLMSQLSIGGRTPKIETPPARVNTSPYEPLRARAEPPAVPIENLVQSSRARAQKVASEMFAREEAAFEREMVSARELARELRESNESYLSELKKSNSESAARAQRQMEDLLARVDATLAPAEIAEAESIVVEDVPNSQREQRFIEHLSRKLTPPGFPADYVKRALRVAIYEARSSREHVPLAQRIRQAVKVGVL